MRRSSKQENKKFGDLCPVMLRNWARFIRFFVKGTINSNLRGTDKSLVRGILLVNIDLLFTV